MSRNRTLLCTAVGILTAAMLATSASSGEGERDNGAAVPTAHAASTAHSVAANAGNNHVFVPLGANNVFPDCVTGCIAVYGTGDRDERAER
jgi:hypothetical protein